jgi:GDP-6-deoxy-D-talose 4-dehydrogenase
MHDFNKPKFKSVLITGASGFTGKYLCKKLHAEGYQVHAMVHNEQQLDAEYAHYQVSKSVLHDIDALNVFFSQNQANIVVHLAALSHVVNTDNQAFYNVNTLYTENLLNAIYKNNKHIEHILIASSANIYGNNQSGKPITEEALPLPQNHYALSKLAMEHMAQWWSNKLPITIVRPFNYTGAGQKNTFLLPKIVQHFAQKKQEIELGNIDIARDFSSIHSIIDCYYKLINTPISTINTKAGKSSCNIYNVCSGRLYYLRDIIKMMEEIAQYSIKININADFIRDNDVNILYGDNTKLTKHIGAIQHIDLVDVLQEMYLNV